MPRTPLTDTLNRPIHDLRISVIDRCNFRCPYCMPDNDSSTRYKFLDKNEWLTFDEIIRLTKIFVHLGVKKIRLTGGEPLLRPGLADLIQKLSQITQIEDLALTTNGSLLAKHAGNLKAAGLKRLTVSIDTLDVRTFHSLNGNKGSLDEVLNGIQEAERCGFKGIKINAVIQKGVNESGALDLVRYFKGTGHVVRFIEYMDVGNCNHWDMKHVLSSKELLARVNAVFALEPMEPNYFGEVAERYRFKDGSGEIGFISSVSQPFCGSCTRARLTTDGRLVTCLFAENGTHLKAALRDGTTDAELSNFISSIWKIRSDRYSEDRASHIRTQQHSHKIEMFQVGG